MVSGYIITSGSCLGSGISLRGQCRIRRRESYVRGLLHIPDELRVVAIIGLGYPEVEPQPKQMYPLRNRIPPRMLPS